MAELKKPSPKERRFCENYVKTPIPSKAAREAGYKGEYTTAWRLMQKPHVLEYIGRLTAELKKQSQLENEQIKEELKKIAFVDISDLHDKDGNLLPMSRMPEHATAAIQEITEKILSRSGDDEDNPTVLLERKVKLHSKPQAMDQLARHTGFYELDNLQKTNFDFSKMTDEELDSFLATIQKIKKE